MFKPMHTGNKLCRFIAVLASAALTSALTARPAAAGTYTNLYQFTGGQDGASPRTSLAYDEKGNLYGTAEAGGVPCIGYPGSTCGTVYKISPTGQETTLVTFNGPNGEDPQGPVTLVDHTLYGGANGGDSYGDGVLFSVHVDGSRFQLLHTFSGLDGAAPVGPLLAGPQGVFYGITYYGGPSGSELGVLFELKPDGRYLHLHNFAGAADGSHPTTLSIDAAGTLYGSTEEGPLCRSNRSECGVVYKYVPATRAFTVLHQFVPPEGIYPMVGSIGPDGTVYGATEFEGPGKQSQGTLFELVPASAGAYTFSTLYAFNGAHPTNDPGFFPSGGPVLTSYGALIGTTESYNGTLYKYKSNHMSVLQSLGPYPYPAPPTLDKNGTIYGTGGQPTFDNPDSCVQFGCGFIYSFLRPAP